MTEDVRKKYLEELMQPHIPLRVLQEIRQEIADKRNDICTDIDDEIAYHVNCGLCSGLDTALELIDKHIREIEGSDTE